MRRQTQGSVFLAALVLATAWCAPAGAGIDQTWDGSESTYWYTPGNWSGNQAPASDDRLMIGDAASGNQPTDSRNVMVDGAGYIKVAGTGAEATFGNELKINSTGDGAGTRGFHVSASGVVKGTDDYVFDPPHLYLDDIPSIIIGGSQNGSAVVTGNGSTWNTGTLTLQWWEEWEGCLEGPFEETHNIGLTVGDGNTGTLEISDGGVVESGDGHLGDWFGSEGTVTVTGAGSLWDVTGTEPWRQDLRVGERGTGTLTISDGGLVKSDRGTLGYFPGSSGTATVTGTGSKWDLTNDLYVGYSGTGTLNIADGGKVIAGTLWASEEDLYGDGTIETRGWVLDADVTVTSPTGTGTFTLDGGGGRTLTVHYDQTGFLGGVSAGYRGTGTLMISGGGVVKSRSGYLGYYSGSEGTATVTGAGSLWEPGWGLTVGREGAGTLTISDGGTVKGENGYLGRLSGSVGTATVTGAGSLWRVLFALCVGDTGAGTLTISDGGVVQSRNGYLGSISGSSGTTTVTGAGSLWDVAGTGLWQQALLVGYNGTGTLTISDGGVVKSRYGTLGYRAGSTGMATVTGAGSLWEVDLALSVGDKGTAALVVSDSGRVKAATVTVGPMGTLEGASGTVEAAVTNFGLVAPGTSTGTLTITGNYAQDSNGTLEIEIGGRAAGEFDRLVVTGDVSLAGTLNVDLINAFSPVFGDAFDVLDWGSLSGTFASPLDLPALGGGLVWDASSLYTEGTLEVTPEPATLALVAAGIVGLAARRRRR